MAGEFEGLSLGVVPTTDGEPRVVTYRTVLQVGAARLTVTGVPGERPATRLCDASTWLANVRRKSPKHPFNTDADREWWILDAHLWRVQSWSTAVQYIKKYCRHLNLRSGASGFGGGR